MMRTTAALLMAVAAAAPLAAQATVNEEGSGTRALLQAVAPVSAEVAWVSGHSGAILRTIDGGSNWKLLPIAGTEKLEFRAIQATSASEAWAMSAGSGALSRIYHTSDGGTTWAMQFTNADSAAFFDCLTFFDSKHGVAFSDAVNGRTTILRTSDGGAHWALLPADKVPAGMKGEGGFAASGGCVVHIDATHGWIATGSPLGRVFGTGDAGASWQLLTDQAPVVHDSSSGWTGVAFRDREHGIGVAARIAARLDTASAVVATTDDGGKHWMLRHRPDSAGALYGIVVVPGAGAQTAIAAGLGGLMLTTDNGDHWAALTTSKYWSVGAFGKRAWGVGPGGRITRVDF